MSSCACLKCVLMFLSFPGGWLQEESASFYLSFGRSLPLPQEGSLFAPERSWRLRPNAQKNFPECFFPAFMEEESLSRRRRIMNRRKSHRGADLRGKGGFREKEEGEERERGGGGQRLLLTFYFWGEGGEDEGGRRGRSPSHLCTHQTRHSRRRGGSNRSKQTLLDPPHPA